jgi:hypothetical protein
MNFFEAWCYLEEHESYKDQWGFSRFVIHA